VLEVDAGDSEDGEIGENEQEGDEILETVDTDLNEDTEKGRPEALKNIERLLCDFLHNQDMKEVMDCIEELKSTQYYSDIVDRGVSLLFDANKDGATHLVKLFRQLAMDGVLTQQHLETGLAPHLEMLDDLLIDFPLALTHLAALVAPLIVDSVLPLSIFSSEAATNLKESGSLGKWFELTLRSIQTQVKDPAFIKKLVQDSKLNLATFFKSSDTLHAFLEDHHELKGLA